MRLVLFAFCLLVMIAPLAVAGQDAKKNDANPEYHNPLRGDLLKQPGFELFGPRADEQVFFEPTGMRLLLPPGIKGGRPNMGLAIPMTVKGDFEITVHFELLQEPETADAGENGTRFSLGIFKDTPKPCVASLSRSVGVKHGPLFVSWWQLWPNPDEPQPPPKSYLSPTKVKTGRLRFARVGKILNFLVSDGEKPFGKIRDNPDFGDENLKLIRLSAATGGERAALEVRLTDLRVRSDEPIPNVPNRAPEVVDVAEPRRTNWLLMAVLASVCVLGLGVIGIGAVVVLRMRGKVAKSERELPTAQTQVTCSQCQKKLRVHAEDAAKKIKCPHCGTVAAKKTYPETVKGHHQGEA